MPQSAAKQSSGIFVSYRSEDTAGYGRQLKELLRKRFGKDQVFWAKDSIGAGREFEQAIKDKLDSCQVLLAVIGRHWLSSVTMPNSARSASRGYSNSGNRDSRIGFRVVAVVAGMR
jgi:hypothetical protein